MSDANNKNEGYNLSPFKRNRYFYGKLMTVKDFNAEQEYMNGKRHLLNRMVNGAGLICGLRLDDVEMSLSDGNVKITFKTGGTAIDRWGREIVIPVQDKATEVYKKGESVKSNLTSTDLTTAGEQNKCYYLYLEYDPRDSEKVSSASENSSCEETCCDNRVIENFEVIASTRAPLPDGIEHPDSPDIPDFSYETQEDEAKREVKEWFRGRTDKLCEAPDDDNVFLLALQKGSHEVDTNETRRCLSFVTNNRAFSELLTSHLSDFNNPHNNLDGLKVEKVEGEGTVDVDHYHGYITIEKDNDITLTPDHTTHRITIGETHSARTDNPHSTTAGQVGALVSVDGVDNPGGDVNLLQEDSITITPDNAAKTITFGETHSARADNPHETSAEQVDALESVNGVRRDQDGNVEIVESNSITITTIEIGEEDSRQIRIGETHSERIDNPHQTTALQVGALESIDGISNPGGDVDLEGIDSITIEADNENNRVRIGETHSERIDNPHQTSAEQSGALVSVGGVSNPGGNVDLVEENSITVTPDDIGNTITIGETHSQREDNPHGTTAQQVGALVSIDGVGNPGGNVGLEAQNSITITPDDVANTIAISETHSQRDDNPHGTIAQQVGALVSIDSVSNPGGDVDLVGENAIQIIPDDTANSITIRENHSTNMENPHQTTAEQVGALSTAGGFVTGPIHIKTKEWSALTGNATETHGVMGRLTKDLEAGSDYRNAGVVGISEIPGKHGVYAKAPEGTHALYVQGPALFTGPKTGYVVDVFKNAGGTALKTGDVVKLKGTPVSRFFGDNDKIPVPEVTLADKENDFCTIGIVDRKAIPEEIKKGKKSKAVDPATVKDGEELYVVTLGTYSRCKVDASNAPIKVGDLLTSSGNPGFAQKAVEPKIGSIIGKALEPLGKGTGFIAVFVNIQ